MYYNTCEVKKLSHLVIDSSSKIPDGLTVGHSKALGNIDECNSIFVSKPRWNGEKLESFR